MGPGGFSQRTMSLILNLRSELALAFVLGLAVLVFRFALVNHRSAERGGRRVGAASRDLRVRCSSVQFIFTGLSALQAAGDDRITQERRKSFLSPWCGAPAGGTSSTR